MDILAAYEASTQKKGHFSFLNHRASQAQDYNMLVFTQYPGRQHKQASTSFNNVYSLHNHRVHGSSDCDCALRRSALPAISRVQRRACLQLAGEATCQALQEVARLRGTCFWRCVLAFLRIS